MIKKKLSASRVIDLCFFLVLVSPVLYVLLSPALGGPSQAGSVSRLHAARCLAGRVSFTGFKLLSPLSQSPGRLFHPASLSKHLAMKTSAVWIVWIPEIIILCFYLKIIFYYRLTFCDYQSSVPRDFIICDEFCIGVKYGFIHFLLHLCELIVFCHFVRKRNNFEILDIRLSFRNILNDCIGLSLYLLTCVGLHIVDFCSSSSKFYSTTEADLFWITLHSTFLVGNHTLCERYIGLSTNFVETRGYLLIG